MSILRFLQRVSKNNKHLFAPRKLAMIIAGTAISSFGIYNIHQQTNITEGGVLGLILLLNHWLNLSPALLTPLLNIICYAFAYKHLGWDFLKMSAVSTLSLSAFFKLWEAFPPLLPNLSGSPLLAAILGGAFVGIGVGLIIRQNGSSVGDDALALAISKFTGWRVVFAYLITDITVLLLSLTYIPLRRILYSLVTVTLSSLLIDLIKNIKIKQKDMESTSTPKTKGSSL